MIDEARLLQRLKAGESSAFRELVDANKRQLFTLAYDLTGNVQEAEDLSQEAFLKAFRHINGFRGECQLSSWLYRITVNLSHNRRRKKALSEMELWENFDGDESHPGRASEHLESNPERMAEAALMRRNLRKALAELPDRQRTVFILRHDHDLPLQRISEILKISEGTVKSQLFRALRKLQKRLAFYRAELKT